MYTTDTFKKKLADISPAIEVIGEYYKVFIGIRCRCRKCGHIWEAKPAGLLRGTGCPMCAGNKKHTTETFREKLKTKSPGIILVGEYRNMRTKASFKCLACGNVWDTIPNIVMQGSGCPACAAKKKREDAAARFAERMSRLDPSIEILGPYTNINSKVRCRCRICRKEWSVTASSLLKNRGRKRCICSGSQKRPT